MYFHFKLWSNRIPQIQFLLGSNSGRLPCRRHTLNGLQPRTFHSPWCLGSVAGSQRRSRVKMMTQKQITWSPRVEFPFYGFCILSLKRGLAYAVQLSWVKNGDVLIVYCKFMILLILTCFLFSISSDFQEVRSCQVNMLCSSLLSPRP